MDSADCSMDDGIQLPKIDRCWHCLHFEMMLNSNCCPKITLGLSSKWSCCRCNCRSRSVEADRQLFARTLCSKRTIGGGIDADAIDANCWQSIALHSMGLTGSLRLKLKRHSSIFNTIYDIHTVNVEVGIKLIVCDGQPKSIYHLRETIIQTRHLQGNTDFFFHCLFTFIADTRPSQQTFTSLFSHVTLLFFFSLTSRYRRSRPMCVTRRFQLFHIGCWTILSEIWFVCARNLWHTYHRIGCSFPFSCRMTLEAFLYLSNQHVPDCDLIFFIRQQWKIEWNQIAKICIRTQYHVCHCYTSTLVNQCEFQRADMAQCAWARICLYEIAILVLFKWYDLICVYFLWDKWVKHKFLAVKQSIWCAYQSIYGFIRSYTWKQKSERLSSESPSIFISNKLSFIGANMMSWYVSQRPYNSHEIELIVNFSTPAKSLAIFTESFNCQVFLIGDNMVLWSTHADINRWKRIDEYIDRPEFVNSIHKPFTKIILRTGQAIYLINRIEYYFHTSHLEYWLF